MPEEIIPLDQAPMQRPLTEALQALNWAYGRGEIVGLDDYHFQGPAGLVRNGHGTVVCQLQYGTARAKFQVTDGNLFFRGHQRKIKG